MPTDARVERVFNHRCTRLLLAPCARLTRSACSASVPLDDDRLTHWSTDDEVKTPDVDLVFRKTTAFNVVRIREFLPLVQRVEAFTLDQWGDDRWIEFFRGITIRSQRLVRIKPPITSDKLRLRILQSPVCRALSKLSVFLKPQESASKRD